MKAGESYENAAKRELNEELSVICELKFLCKVFNEFEDRDLRIRYFTGIFIARYSEKINMNEEITEVKRMSIGEIENIINKNKDLFTPGFVHDFLFIKDKIAAEYL